MKAYPRWKYWLALIIIIVGTFYALPNFYGEDPAVQVSPQSGFSLDEPQLQQMKSVLSDAGMTAKSVEQDDQTLLIRFTSADEQIKAQELLQAQMGEHYTVALNLAASTPSWMEALGAQPMKLGLDLRGGVHFLLAIDVDSLIQRRLAGDLRSIAEELRHDRIRYTNLKRLPNKRIQIQFRDQKEMDGAVRLIHQRFQDLQILPNQTADPLRLVAQVSPQALLKAQDYAVDQTMTILRNRVNELGVAEPIVQRQGAARIAVDLPGIQDTARAKQILGGTATVEMHMVDTEHDPSNALNGHSAFGSSLYQYDGVPYLLYNRVILSGASITGATANIGQDGRAAVDIRLGGGGEGAFYRSTRENIGNPMAIVYVETKMDSQIIDGEVVYKPRKSERVISVATIKSALGNNFQITGLTDPKEGRNLALLLRTGALPAPISIIEESTIGPSMGKENVEKGVISVVVGFVFIIVFMLAYYRLFGLVANIALGLNLILLMALLSILGATLTLPGIAGIVLTVGMAVDANVLIFERIREELRNGLSAHASIQAGFEKAFSTIVDSNVTTLIAAVALFALGTGAVKGFAVTVTLGLLTSMFTAILVSRAIIQLIYGKRAKIKKLSIGI